MRVSLSPRLDQMTDQARHGGPAKTCEGVDPMGRGRAKAKQTKVARELKYREYNTDFSELQRELHGDEISVSRQSTIRVQMPTSTTIRTPICTTTVRSQHLSVDPDRLTPVG